MPKTLYEKIGVHKRASNAEIEARCIELGEKYNPSNNPGDLNASIRFAEVEEAYATLLDSRKRAAYDVSISGSRPSAQAIYVWGGAAAVVLIVMVVYWAHSLSQEQKRRQIAAQKAEAAERQRVEMERARIQRESEAKRRLEEAAKLASVRPDVTVRGRIQSEEDQRRDAQRQSDRLKGAQARSQLVIAQTVLADLKRLEPHATEVQMKLDLIVSRSGRYGAGGWYGWGERKARQVEAMSVTGCAQNVRDAIAGASRGFDQVAHYYMNIPAIELDSRGGNHSGSHNVMWATMRECQRLANGDVRHFSVVR